MQMDNHRGRTARQTLSTPNNHSKWQTNGPVGRQKDGQKYNTENGGAGAERAGWPLSKGSKSLTGFLRERQRV